MDKGARYRDDVGVVQMVQVQKKRNIIEKSLGKLKEIGTDIWQGTQLLAIDATAAMGLLRSVLIGDELTEKEKKTLKRTLTDMASIVPIGVLMLLPLNLFIYCICVWGASTLPKKCYISVYQGKVLLVLLVC
ncbi:hypothetical protein GLYMA_03G198750v4 [Glycine max]|nr:hypothetical protein GLYMA_03G198750v4 [Glycine max]KAH1070914.1 hypothetical protein GYH30_007783 [Glycine max]